MCHEPKRLKMKSASLILLVVMILTACNDSGQTILNVIWQNDQVEVIQYDDNGSLFTFIRQKRSDASMDALNEGLFLVDGGCTVLQHNNQSPTLVWPAGFSVERVNGAYRISDGNLIIESGDSLQVSGGFYSQIPSTFCTGEFWLIGNELRVLN